MSFDKIFDLAAGWSVFSFIIILSCQILSPSETGFIVSAHRLTKIILMTLIATL